VTNSPAQTDLVQLVVDFEPGAWTSLHTHGGQAINLVLQGEITLRHGGVDHPYKAGQSWTDSTGQIHAAGNTGTGKARLLTNFLLPKGAPQITVVQESQFGPVVTYEAAFPLPPLPMDAEIAQQVIDLPPGSHMTRAFPGFTATLVMDGELRYRIGSQWKSYKPGDSWMAQAGTAISEQNDTSRPARRSARRRRTIAAAPTAN
jgi:quercetin dioxygenase-like cupin family protein